MSPRLRRLLAYGASFGLAGLLLWLALRNIDFSEIGEALRNADYRWLIPLAIVTLISHALRAWRWTLLLEALPERRSSQQPVSVLKAFYAVMIGYMVNYAAPRLGEVVRTANLAAQERLAFTSVLGTVVIERILDVVVLAVSILTVLYLLRDQLLALTGLFESHLDALPVGLLALGLLGLALIALLLVYAYRSLAHSGDPPGWFKKLQGILTAFRQGLATVIESDRRGALLWSTGAIWFCYVLMAYLPFVLFGMDVTYGITLGDAWCIMILGAIGVAIPSPGGAGTYHAITIATLVTLFQVDAAPAASYAILSHAGQMLLYIGVGALALVLQGGSLKDLLRPPSTREEQPG